MEEALRPLSQYSGDDAFVKGQIYSLGNGGDMYKYSNNLKSYNKALEDAKANDNDNFWTGLGDFFVGRGADKLKADMADEYVKAFNGNPYEFAGDDYNNNADKIRTEQDFEQGRAFNGGLIGSLINPITQVGKAGADLGAGIGGNWDAWNKRDHLSDIGALGETALMVAPYVGSGIKAIRGASAAAKGVDAASKLGKVGSAVKSFTTAHPAITKLGKNALGMGGWSALGALNEYGSDIGNHIPETALRVGIGSAIGAATGGIGYGLGKVWNKYAPATKTETVTTMGDATPYQEALNSLKNNATGARYSDVATNLPTTQGPDLARITLDNLDDDTLKTLYRSASRNTHPDKVGEEVGNKLFKSVNENNNLLQDFLKNGIPTSTTTNTIPLTGLERLKSLGSNIPNMGKDLANTKAGTKVANLLKTKKGKVMAGAGGGLLLAQLMKNNNNNNSNSGELTDEEMQELYNYVYGGGQ